MPPTGVPVEFEGTLRQMVAPVAAARLPAAAFATCPWLQGDVQARGYFLGQGGRGTRACGDLCCPTPPTGAARGTAGMAMPAPPPLQLRALRFLDGMLQREPVAKAAFLRDLPALCAQFDARVLRYCVSGGGRGHFFVVFSFLFFSCYFPFCFFLFWGMRAAAFMDLLIRGWRPPPCCPSGALGGTSRPTARPHCQG